MFYIKFHLPRLIFYLPSSEFTCICKQVSISLSHWETSPWHNTTNFQTGIEKWYEAALPRHPSITSSTHHPEILDPATSNLSHQITWAFYQLLITKTPLLHMLYYLNWLTHDFWTRTEGWEFDRSHGAGTSSPSHWEQIEEQAPKPVGWMMCFLLMTLVPVQKLCVNIYIYMHSLYEFCYRTYTYIYNGSAIQYWKSCTPSRSIGLYFWGVRGSWAECLFLVALVYQLCLALW